VAAERDADATEQPAQEEGKSMKVQKQKKRKDVAKEEGSLCDRCQRPGDKHRKSCERYVAKETVPRARARKPKAKKQKKDTMEAAAPATGTHVTLPIVQGHVARARGVA
jgi:hypothetical protein